MKLLYYCHNCGDFIDELTVDKVDEKKLGFDLLTPEEKQDIIKSSKSGNMLYVRSICDNCYQDLSNIAGNELKPYHDQGLYSEYEFPRLH
ncbi:hypothetical protein BBF96_14935 [Anoxybacter fermentans]|uniref:Peptide ABC transporter permease n=1 Tax=Anoxybacter fermentans TaxID=1323375 RepID=A0A3Q9HS76_9FIRM|nr:anti-sigma-F factor Fin [Anoxybacter fermentans]AZR74569.1 hypothetical protein BBF96_14935 [Anoxybacter fermentans]